METIETAVAHNDNVQWSMFVYVVVAARQENVSIIYYF